MEQDTVQSQPVVVHEIMRIDIDAVLRDRAPGVRRFMPRWLVRCLERIICQDQLNEMLEVCRGKRDADFCRGVMEHLDIELEVKHADRLPDPSHRRVTIVSNHPLGGLDGMALIDRVTAHWGPGVKFVVNDLLMAIEPLRGTFIPINKHGSQSRGALNSLDSAMASDDPVIVFPAGLVSRHGADGVVKDLEWRKMFVNKSIQYHRDIIPIHFGGHNSGFFYKFARLRTRLGLKLNLEMVRLPAEVFKSRGSHYVMTVGEMIPWTQLEGGVEAAAQAAKIKETVYALSEDGAKN